jgi:hypothetical protein
MDLLRLHNYFLLCVLIPLHLQMQKNPKSFHSSQIPDTESELMKKSKGRSRKARYLRKQQELLQLCKNAHKTSMTNYLAVLVVLVEALHIDKRWMICFYFSNNLTSVLPWIRIRIHKRIQIRIDLKFLIHIRIRIESIRIQKHV